MKSYHVYLSKKNEELSCKEGTIGAWLGLAIPIQARNRGLPVLNWVFIQIQ